jgi:hypothetical protein
MSDLKSPQFGGGGGAPFDDAGFIGKPITQMTVCATEAIDSIQVTYGGQQGPRHGGGGGQPHDISLAPGEQIIVVFGRWGDHIDQIGFVTQLPNNDLRTHGPYGANSGHPFYIIGKVDAFYGQAGEYLDAVGVWVQPPVLVSGG